MTKNVKHVNIVDMIKTKLDRLLIYDLEATCYHDKTKKTEIIEIGIVPLDLDTLEVREDIAFSSLIINRKTEISEFCTELTGITQQMIKERGKDFADVCNTISKFYSKKYPSASWGNYDDTKLKLQCDEYGIEFPFGKTHHNLKNLYALLTGDRNEKGLANALKERKMEFKGTQHCALDDAINTALVFANVLKELGIKRKRF